MSGIFGLDFSQFGSGDQPRRRVIDPPAAGRQQPYNLVAHVTVSEDSEDELEITQHPVEQGSMISDHSFKRPAILRVQLGWTQSAVLPRSASGGTPVADVRTIYEKILFLQASRQPFSVFTGKRHYDNMLVQSVRTSTDEKTETSLLVDIIFHEVIFATTQLLSSHDTSALPNSDPGKLANPPLNQPGIVRGPVQTMPGSGSDPGAPPINVPV